GFALDQTAYASTANLGTVGAAIPSTASEVPLSGSTTPYGFAQAAIAGAVPAGTGTSRTTQTLSGSFGGLMYTNAHSTPYIVTGSTSISTDAPNNRIQATLAGSAQASSAGATSLTMQYGGLTGNAGGRQAFIDDKTFAVLESVDNPQQITLTGPASPPARPTYIPPPRPGTPP